MVRKNGMSFITKSKVVRPNLWQIVVVEEELNTSGCIGIGK